MWVDVSDFHKRNHRNLPNGTTEDEIRLALEEAEGFLRSTFIRIPEEPIGPLLRALQIVTSAITKRALLAERNAQYTDGAESYTDTSGPFTTTQSFRNSEGNLYISSQEREMLENELDKLAGQREFRCITAEGW